MRVGASRDRPSYREKVHAAPQAVCSVLTGPRGPEELEGILAWWNTPIPEAFWAALAERRLVAPETPLPNGQTA